MSPPGLACVCNSTRVTRTRTLEQPVLGHLNRMTPGQSSNVKDGGNLHLPEACCVPGSVLLMNDLHLQSQRGRQVIYCTHCTDMETDLYL